VFALLTFTVAAQTYHFIEHSFKMGQFLETGMNGTPGILGHAFSIVWLHFWLNAVVTAPLLIAFFVGRYHRDLALQLPGIGLAAGTLVGVGLVVLILAGFAPSPRAQAVGPTDTDGDGCTDQRELQAAAGSEFTGGLRDPASAYDFFDVPLPPGPPGTGARDRVANILDIIGVLAKFGTHDNGTPNDFSDDPANSGGQRYNPDFDRTFVGPAPWNTGPGDGANNIFDVILALAQFGHGCAPQLVPIPDQQVALGSTLNFSVKRSPLDAKLGGLTVEPLPLPANATFHVDTGEFSFRPTASQVGSHQLTFGLSEGGRTWHRDAVTIDVKPGSGTTTLRGTILSKDESMNDVPLQGVRLELGTGAPVETFSVDDGSRTPLGPEGSGC
jgi:hypothetical protein